jgi:hypothetical protein
MGTKDTLLIGAIVGATYFQYEGKKGPAAALGAAAFMLMFTPDKEKTPAPSVPVPTSNYVLVRGN